MRDDGVARAYAAGFMDKCAEYGVDTSRMTAHMLRMPSEKQLNSVATRPRWFGVEGLVPEPAEAGEGTVPPPDRPGAGAPGKAGGRGGGDAASMPVTPENLTDRKLTQPVAQAGTT